MKKKGSLEITVAGSRFLETTKAARRALQKHAETGRKRHNPLGKAGIMDTNSIIRCGLQKPIFSWQFTKASRRIRNDKTKVFRNSILFYPVEKRRSQTAELDGFWLARFEIGSQRSETRSFVLV